MTHPQGNDTPTAGTIRSSFVVPANVPPMVRKCTVPAGHLRGEMHSSHSCEMHSSHANAQFTPRKFTPRKCTVLILALLQHSRLNIVFISHLALFDA